MPSRNQQQPACRIGVLSDTHGLLRDTAVEALQGVDHIVHAGDVGTPEVLHRLRRLAPVTAVRGNMDRGALAMELAGSETVRLEGVWVHVLHDLAGLDLDPAAAGIDLVISGHSHRPSRHRRDGVLYLNPGSAGPRRFKLPVSLVILEIRNRTIQAAFRTLEP